MFRYICRAHDLVKVINNFVDTQVDGKLCMRIFAYNICTYKMLQLHLPDVHFNKAIDGAHGYIMINQ